MLKIINVEKDQKEGSSYVNWKLTYLSPRVINGQSYDSVKTCKVSDYVVKRLVDAGQIKNPGELIGKNCYIGKSVDAFLSPQEKQYGFLNWDTILLFK